MEKYLKINWSIRLILLSLLFIIMLLILSNIYWIIFFSWIKEALIFLGDSTIGKISIPILILSLILQLWMFYIITCVMNYKRWAIALVGLFVWLPGVLLSIWILYILSGLYANAITSDGTISFTIVAILAPSFTWCFIKANIELIRLYKNIKNLDTVDTKIIQITKPKFYSLLFISMTPVIILAGFMIVFYNPVVPLDLPDRIIPF